MSVSWNQALVWNGVLDKKMAKRERKVGERECEDRKDRWGLIRGRKERDWKVEDAEGEKEYVYCRIRTFFQKQIQGLSQDLDWFFQGSKFKLKPFHSQDFNINSPYHF